MRRVDSQAQVGRGAAFPRWSAIISTAIVSALVNAEANVDSIRIVPAFGPPGIGTISARRIVHFSRSTTLTWGEKERSAVSRMTGRTAARSAWNASMSHERHIIVMSL